uniref:LysR family transcriptional regulator n=1 Tax=Mangrovicoccus ximenensis TaxID=1911570 RepID=UPI000D378132
MSIPRRFLPSISSLVALEAVDRLGSAVAAAQDLSLTHSAVSRQLKVLEEQIGVPLFRRDGKGLALTPAGAGYARAVRGVLEDLGQASLRLRRSRRPQRLPSMPTAPTMARMPDTACGRPKPASACSAPLRIATTMVSPIRASVKRRGWKL